MKGYNRAGNYKRITTHSKRVRRQERAEERQTKQIEMGSATSYAGEAG